MSKTLAEMGPHPKYGYGIWDSRDGFWMGTQKGPFVYQDAKLAQMFAEALDLSVSPVVLHRFVVMPFTSATRKHDELKLKRPINKTLDLMEQGKI